MSDPAADPRGLTGTVQNLVWQDASHRPRWERAVIGAVRVVWAVVRDVTDGQITLRAMSLVYTTLLSLVPLLAISFSILKGFGVHNQIEPFLRRTMEPLGERRDEVVSQIVGFVDNVQVGVLGFRRLSHAVLYRGLADAEDRAGIQRCLAGQRHPNPRRALQGLPERHRGRAGAGVRFPRHHGDGHVRSTPGAYHQLRAGGHAGGIRGPAGAGDHGVTGVHQYLHLRAAHPGPVRAGPVRRPGGRTDVERPRLGIRLVRGAGQQLHRHLLGFRHPDPVHDLAVCRLG